MSPEIRPVGSSSKACCLIHADIGTGKTSFLGTGGRDFRILIMRPPTDHADPIRGSGCHEMVVRNWEDTFEGLDYIMHNAEDWDIFAMDSISLLQDIGLDDVYEGILDRAGPHGSAARNNRQQFGPDRGEYRVNMWRVGQWVRHAVAAESFHLFVMAHSFWYTPEGADAAYLAPWIQGKAMPEKICGMMNMVGHMTVREREVRGTTRESRVIQWNKSASIYAKNQFKSPPDYNKPIFPDGRTVNLTLPELMEAVGKGKTEKPKLRRSAPVARRPAGRQQAAGRSTGRTTAPRPTGRSTGRSTGRRITK